MQLQEDIKKYNEGCLKKQKAIQNGEYISGDFDGVVRNVEEEYARISKEIQYISNASKWTVSSYKKALIESLVKEMKELLDRDFVIKEEFKAANLSESEIPILKAITDKNAELGQILTYMQFEGESLQLVSGIVANADSVRRLLVESLRGQRKYLYDSTSNPSAKMDDIPLYGAIKNEIYTYAAAMEQAATTIKDSLITLSKKQSWNNKLWKNDAVEAVNAALLAQPVQLIFNDNKRMGELLAHDIKIMQTRNMKYIERYNQRELNLLVSRVVRVQTALTKAKLECRSYLNEIENEEFNTEMSAAKQRCIENVNKYKSIIEQIDPSSLAMAPVNIKPEALKLAYQEYQKKPKEKPQIEFSKIPPGKATNFGSTSVIMSISPKKQPNFLEPSASPMEKYAKREQTYGTFNERQNDVETRNPVISNSTEFPKRKEVTKRGGRDRKKEDEPVVYSTEARLLPHPPVVKEEPSASFWQRHRKKILIGAGIGFGLLMVTTVVLGLVFAPEITIPGLLSVGGAVVSKFGILGTVGLAVGAFTAFTGSGAATGATIGAIQDSCMDVAPEKQPLLQKPQKQEAERETKGPSYHDSPSNTSRSSRISTSVDIVDVRKSQDGQTSVVVSSFNQPRPNSMTMYRGPATQHAATPMQVLEKAFAKRIINLIWKEVKAPNPENQKRILDTIDQIEGRAQEAFEKNWTAWPEHRLKFKEILIGLLQEYAISTSDFEGSFLNNYYEDDNDIHLCLSNSNNSKKFVYGTL